MRLLVSGNSANEQLIALVNAGYKLMHSIRTDYNAKKAAGSYSEAADNPRFSGQIDQWGGSVQAALLAIFPTELEWNLFLHPAPRFNTVSGDYAFECLMLRLDELIRGLDKIRQSNIPQYTDLPQRQRLFVEDIDSFRKVRDVNPASVTELLDSTGRIEWAEDRVQLALEQILDVPMHKKDWRGESNDLYTANTLLNGRRIETAFLLKGNGLKSRVMQISVCGKNGDQLLRLVNSPARLFVVQYVGAVSEAVIADVEGKVQSLRSRGRDACYCIIDGQDTARVLRAYRKA